MVRAEAKGLGLTINPKQISRGLLSSTIQTLIKDGRYVKAREGRAIFVMPVLRCFYPLPISLFLIFSQYFSFSRFKSSALSLSRIHKSHPVPPTLRLIQWVEHILHSEGGAHLKPASLTQPWYQRYLLDLMLLFLLVLLGPLALCWTNCRNKNSRDKHQKIQ